MKHEAMKPSIDGTAGTSVSGARRVLPEHSSVWRTGPSAPHDRMFGEQVIRS